MNVGLIARSEDRGLGVMTWAFHRNMAPARTLLVAPAPNIARGFRQHHDRFPDATIIRWDGGPLDEAVVRDWLDGLDVVYTAETFYDPALPDWARQQGVGTVLHAMPEFYNANLPAPTAVWNPTPWRNDEVMGRVVPVPVEPPPVNMTHDAYLGDRPLRVLHVAGHRAMADRNGTLAFLQSLRAVREPCEAVLLCQDQRAPKAQGVSPKVKYRSVVGPQASLDEWWEWADVLVMPRRYGGLCLPVQEALAHGVPVIMPAVPPNTWWPVTTVPTETSTSSITTVSGEYRLPLMHPHRLADAIQDFARDPGLLGHQRARALKWAHEHSWPAMRAVYDAELGLAADASRGAA